MKRRCGHAVDKALEVEEALVETTSRLQRSMKRRCGHVVDKEHEVEEALVKTTS
jgi:hypothetical protein